MRFFGSVPIAAPRDRVWAFVDDIERVARCAPGVDSVDVREEGLFVAHARIGFGPFWFRFAIDGQVVDRVEGERAAVHAWGRAPGTEVDGTSRMVLRDADGGTTVMEWSVDVRFSGRLATLGARLVHGTARKMIRQLLVCIRAELESAQESRTDG